MIMLLDKSGGQVTSWVDTTAQKHGEMGHYLHWGIVEITFCDYSDTGSPEFLLITSSNLSKLAGRYGDQYFHANTMATRKDEPKSQDPVFPFVALAILQQAFPDKLKQVFTDQAFGLSLLKKHKFKFIFTAKETIC